MSSTLDFRQVRALSDTGEGRPFLLEVVGPAGAGKTLATVTLKDTTPGVQVLRRVRKKENAVLVARNSLSLLPIVLRHATSPGRGCKSCLHTAMFLKLMDSLVQTRLRGKPRAIVIDEGPVYMMAKMATISHLPACTSRVQRMIDETATRWSGRLDLVVVLDGQNEVLAERIRSRTKNHIVKREDNAVIMSFLETWRESIGQACDRLNQFAPVPVVRIDSSHADPESVACELRRLIVR